jgi:UDP-N-acetylmuramate--alanine ligase
MITSLNGLPTAIFHRYCGTGMSAIAQYLKGIGMNVSGSDRYFNKGEAGEIRQKLSEDGILCFPQDGTGINENTDLVVVSTAWKIQFPKFKKRNH